MANEGEAQQIIDQSVIMAEITITQVMHPEQGELILLSECGGTSNHITPGDKLKMIEMAKIYIVQDILDGTGTIE